MGESRSVAVTELPARIGFVIRADKCEPNAAICKSAQHRVDARKQGNVGHVRGLQLPHVPRDRRQLPERHIKASEDFTRTGAPQRLDVLVVDPAETELVGDAVHVASKQRQAVRQRPVEIENDEGKAHQMLLGTGQSDLSLQRDVRSCHGVPGLTILPSQREYGMIRNDGVYG